MSKVQFQRSLQRRQSGVLLPPVVFGADLLPADASDYFGADPDLYLLNF